jgi:kinesin family protein 1/kinesin family protein 3/17
MINPADPSDEQTFAYDFVYGMNTEQANVYQDVGAPILARAFSGFNGTIFAYGQTGSGKTWSMTGSTDKEADYGIIPRLNMALFQRVEEEQVTFPRKRFLVVCSFFEIYNEIIYDLLDDKPRQQTSGGGLQVKEHTVLGIYVKGLQEIVVETSEKIKALMAQGASNRTTGSTQMNAESSRSHSVFTIKIHQKDADDETKNLFAKINLVDLAGSERASRTGAAGARLKEGANINKSLSALGGVINGLVEKARGNSRVFIPYRNSKLTRVLQESLGGNSLCSMVATLSPAVTNFQETLGTLKYASRAKTIKVNAVKNEEQGQISKLNEEVQQLKAKLAAQMAEMQDQGATVDAQAAADKEELYRKQIAEIEAVSKQSWEDKAKVSQQYETDRKKFRKEKEAAKRQIEKERQRRIAMLEAKGDIEMSVKELGLPMVWAKDAAALTKQEAEVTEQRTLLHVFKTAVMADLKSWWNAHQQQQASANQHINQPADLDSANATAALTLAKSRLEQAQAKLGSLTKETQTLVALEDTLTASCDDLIARFERFAERASTKGAAPAGKDETASASASRERSLAKLELVQRQLKARKVSIERRIRTERRVIAVGAKQDFEAVDDSNSSDGDGCGRRDSGSSSSGTLQASTKLLQEALEEALKQDSTDDASLRRANELLLKACAALTLGGGDTPREQASKPVADPAAAAAAAAQATAAAAAVKAEEDHAFAMIAWAAEPASHAVNPRMITGGGESGRAHLRNGRAVAAAAAAGGVPGTASAEECQKHLVDAVRDLPWVAVSASASGISTVPASIQVLTAVEMPACTPGSAPTTAVPAADVVPAAAAEVVVTAPAEPIPAADTVSGAIEATYALLGRVVDWEALLHTTKLPSKLLNRPPVRFIHDIVAAVDKATGVFSDGADGAAGDENGETSAANDSAGAGDDGDATKCPGRSWGPAELESSSALADKSSRTAFLDRLIAFVRYTLTNGLSDDGEVRVDATAANISQGKMAEHTNELMQLLAIAALRHQQKQSPPQLQPPGEESKEEEVPVNADGGSGSGSGSGTSTSGCFVSAVAVLGSMDGTRWYPALAKDRTLLVLKNPDREGACTVQMPELHAEGCVLGGAVAGFRGRHFRLVVLEWQGADGGADGGERKEEGESAEGQEGRNGLVFMPTVLSKRDPPVAPPPSAPLLSASQSVPHVTKPNQSPSSSPPGAGGAGSVSGGQRGSTPTIDLGSVLRAMGGAVGVLLALTLARWRAEQQREQAKQQELREGVQLLEVQRREGERMRRRLKELEDREQEMLQKQRETEAEKAKTEEALKAAEKERDEKIVAGEEARKRGEEAEEARKELVKRLEAAERETEREKKGAKQQAEAAKVAEEARVAEALRQLATAEGLRQKLLEQLASKEKATEEGASAVELLEEGQRELQQSLAESNAAHQQRLAPAQAQAAASGKAQDEAEEAKAVAEAEARRAKDEATAALAKANAAEEKAEEAAARAKAAEVAMSLRVQEAEARESEAKAAAEVARAKARSKEEEITAEAERGVDEAAALRARAAGAEQAKTVAEETVASLEEKLLVLQTDGLRVAAEQTSAAQRLQAAVEARGRAEEAAAAAETAKEEAVAAEIRGQEEREEMHQQVQVAEEERDTARAKEEELTYQLGVAVDQLDDRAKGYVYLTDRCNDYQDEIDDLREQLERTEDLLESMKQNVVGSRKDDGGEHQAAGGGGGLGFGGGHGVYGATPVHTSPTSAYTAPYASPTSVYTAPSPAPAYVSPTSAYTAPTPAYSSPVPAQIAPIVPAAEEEEDEENYDDDFEDDA